MKRLSEAQFREKSLSATPYLLIIQIGIPLAVFALFASLFSLLDTIMASHLGTIEVSTVAYMNQIRMILNSIGTGLGTGSMILINRAYGARDMKRTNELTNTLIRLLLILSAVFLIMIPFVPWILRAIRTPEEFIEEGTAYFRLLILATVVNFVNLVYINVEKSRGRTGIILLVNMAMMVLKLVLTATFIYVLDKGIAYIALATFITYASCAIYALPHLFNRKSIFCIRPSLIFHPTAGYSRSLLGISYPVAVEDSAFSLGKVIVNSLASSYGAEMIGALGISNNVSGLAASFENGFSDASSSIISQNYGAGKYKRAVKVYIASIAVTFLACFFALSILYASSSYLIPVFATSRSGFNQEFMEIIQRIFVYDSVSCLGIAIGGAGMDFLLGLGKTRITLLMNFLKIFVFRIPVLLILQLLIADGATALGVMMMISNCGTAIPITIISIYTARKLCRAEERKMTGNQGA